VSDAACLAITRFVESVTANAADGIESLLERIQGQLTTGRYKGSLLSPVLCVACTQPLVMSVMFPKVP
jgi:hypothetical protein